MSRIGCAFLAVALGACRPSAGPTPPESRAPARAETPAEPTWKREQSWTQLRAVAIDPKGRVAVVGHRLVEGDPLRAVGVVQVYDTLGELAWERTIDASWVEGVEVAAPSYGGFVALMHERRGDVDESVVYSFDAVVDVDTDVVVDDPELDPVSSPLDPASVDPPGSVHATANAIAAHPRRVTRSRRRGR